MEHAPPRPRSGALDDHRAALARVPPARLAALSRLSDRAGAGRLAAHLGALGLTGALVLASDGPARLAAQAAHGAALCFLFAACHEAIHRTAFRTGRLNDWLAQGAGFLILLPAHHFRYFHFAHHRFTQDPARDPELATPKPRTLGEYLWKLTGWGYWRGQAAALLGAALGRPLPAYVPPRGEGKVRAEARAFLAGYALVAALSVAAGSSFAWDLWVLPALLGQPALRAYLLPEHAGCPTTPDMLENTRTTFAGRLVRLFAWEGSFHTAHHAAPTVPFHGLPGLTEELAAALRSRADGYLDAHRRILAALTGRG